LNTLRREVLDPYGAFTVGETVFVDLEKARLLTDPARKELDMVFSFEHMEVDQVIVKWFKTRLVPGKLMKVITKWQQGLPWNATYFENHDQPRFISRFSDSQGHRRACSKMIAGLVMTLRGTPYIYEGQEIGMKNGDFADMSEIRDIESHNIYKLARRLHLPRALRWKMIMRTSRDHARTPMQWDWSENAGFTTGTPWLKVNGNHKHISVARDTADPIGISAFYKKMIALRRTCPVLMEGSFEPLCQGRQVYAFKREHEGRALVSVMNMTAKPARLPEQAAAYRSIIACNYEEASAMLRPFEYRLLAKPKDAEALGL
ncbi:MAG: glucohydrolase, partial [Clostridiales bacterium]|nr:glucohydrolase [Clostridiales bacterium]